MYSINAKLHSPVAHNQISTWMRRANFTFVCQTIVNRNPLLHELCRQKDLNSDRNTPFSVVFNLFTLENFKKKIVKMAPRKAKATAETKVIFNLIGFFIFQSVHGI